MMRNPKVTNMRLKSVSTQQEVERSPIGSELQRYNENSPVLNKLNIFHGYSQKDNKFFFVSKAPQVKKVANYMEIIQICDPASDKTITQERSLSIRKSTNRPKVTKG
jgi:hypothetical protein